MAKADARTVLWYLVFVGFAVNYMIRINLNITIVDMVAQTKKDLEKFKLSDECIGEQILEPQFNPSIAADHLNANFSVWSALGDNITEFNGSAVILSIDNSLVNITRSRSSRFSLEKALLQWIGVSFDGNGFSWNEYQQGLVLGAFFWLHWITQIPGGILAKKYGTKLVFGLANVIGCWICFLLPLVSYWDYKALIFFRAIQGIVCGLAWPAMHHMTAQWIPPNERSKFVTAYLGSSVGIAVFYPVFGYVIAWTSWEWVFHLCGVFGTLWYVAWVFLVFDTPATHPRISEKERKYIEKSLGASVQNNKGPTPWRAILTSKPVWMNVIAQWGGIWGLFTLMTQAPTYFKTIHGWDIKMTGILSGLPHMMRMIFAYLFSTFGDYLLRSDKMSRTNVRKLATTMCCIVKGIFVLALAYSGCDAMAAIAFLTLATAVHGAVSTGPLASIVDIAPNYAGIVLGISGMIGVLPGFISPAIVGILTLGNQSVTSWKYVFLITAGMLIVCGVLYVLLCESNLQEWNNPPEGLDKEMQQLTGSKQKDLNGDGKDQATDHKKEEKQLLSDKNRGCIVKGIFVLALAYSGCDAMAAIAFLTLATAVHGAVSTGPLASIVDIAPNYAGIVLGISGMIGVLPGFISPAIVGILTLGNQSVTSWKYVFLITAGMLIVCGVLYVLLCESNLQEWNNPPEGLDKEMQQLTGSKQKDLNGDGKDQATDHKKEEKQLLSDKNRG